MKNLVMTTLAIAGLASATIAATVSEKGQQTSREVSSVSVNTYDNNFFQDTTKHKGKKGDYKSDKSGDKKHEHHKKDSTGKATKH